MEKRRQPEIIAGRVNADGSIAAGDGFTVQKTGVGAYAVTFGSGFRLIAGTASGNQYNQVAGANFSSQSVLSIATFLGSTGAATDLVFSFVAVGVQQ